MNHILVEKNKDMSMPSDISLFFMHEVIKSLCLCRYTDLSHKKSLKSYDFKLLDSWATRIRTLKMLESESSALPFGDSPLPQQMVVYINYKKNASVFFEKNIKIFLDLLETEYSVIFILFFETMYVYD